jgi:hypothetical protein
MQRLASPRQIFDERTARTVLVVAAPLVFARDRADVAAHAHDFVTVVAVEIDESGEYDQYFMVYRWTTVDRRMLPAPDLRSGAIRVVADGRVIDMTPQGTLPLSLDRSRELLVPNHGDVVVNAYKVNPELLRYIARSRSMTVRMPDEPLTSPFRLWLDGRGALVEFLSRAASP